MKTHQNGLRATLAALCAFVIIAFCFGPSRVEAQSPVILDVYALATTPVTKAIIDADGATQVAVIAPANMAAATTNFGCKLRSTDGANGTFNITKLSYDFAINGAPALDGNFAEMTDRSFGPYLNPGSPGSPYIRAFRADNSQVTLAQNTQTANSSVSGAASIVLESFGFTPTGSVRRPFFTEPGQYYSITFHATGTRDGIPFNVQNTAWVLTGATAPTSFIISCFDGDSVDLVWTDVSGETGYRVEKTLNDGALWTPVATLAANTTGYTVNGLDIAGTSYMFRVVALGVGPAAGDSVPSSFVAPPRIVSSVVDEGQWVITVYGQPFTLNHVQFSINLTSWSSAPEGSALNGTGPTYEIRVPMADRGFARITPCNEG